MIELALRRQEVFRHLEKHLKKINEVVSRIDPKAKVYLFGSAAEGKHVLSSDIDILIVTREDPAKICTELWKNGIKEPFEVHIQPPEKAHLYLKRGKFVEID